MARYFDNDSVTFDDHAALSLGDDVDDSGPFSFSFWLRLGTQNDAFTHYFSSWNNYDATPSCNIVTYGDNHATAARRIRIVVEGGNGVTCRLFTDDAIDNIWHHIVFAFDGTTMRSYLDGIVQATSTNSPSLDRVDFAGTWYFGRFAAGNLLKDSSMAEWAKWDAALNTEQITALADGVRPPEIGTRPAWYLPLLAGLEEEIAALSVTNSGTTVAEHPPKIISPAVSQALLTIWPAIAGPYQVLATATHASGAAEGQIFSTGTMIGQVNEQ